MKADDFKKRAEDIRQWLSHANGENPVWKGVLALLDVQIQQSTQIATDPGLPPGVRDFACGDLAALRAFRDALERNVPRESHA